MASKAREVLFTGGFPLQGASKVFETIAEHIGTLAPRYPDGEQIGWIQAQRRGLPANPALEQVPGAPTNVGGNPGFMYRLKKGMTAKDLKLGPYGYGEAAIASYGEFKRLQDAGKIPARTRFQATQPDPVHVATVFEGVPPDQLFPVCEAATWREIERTVNAIPAKA